MAAHIQLRKNLAMRKPSEHSPNSLSECSICLYPIGVCHPFYLFLTCVSSAWTSVIRCIMFTYMAFQMHTAHYHRALSSLHVSELSPGCRSRGPCRCRNRDMGGNPPHDRSLRAHGRCRYSSKSANQDAQLQTFSRSFVPFSQPERH